MIIIYGNDQTYLPLSIVYLKPYNEAADMVINDELFQADAEIQKTVSKILAEWEPDSNRSKRAEVRVLEN